MEVEGRRSLNSRVQNNQDFSLCLICQSNGTNIHSHGYCKTCEIHLCTSCLNIHQSKEQNRTHMIKYQGCLNKDPDGGYSNYCDEHKTEIMSLYCQRHDFVGCLKCMNFSHKTCLVQQIADMSRNYGNSREFHMIKEEMDNLMVEVVYSKQEIVSSLNTAQKMKEKQTEKVKTFHADLKTYLKVAEAEILQEVEQMYTKDVNHHKQLYDKCETMETEINKYREQLDHHSLESDHLFASVKQAKKNLRDFQESAETMTVTTKLNTYEFQPSSDLLALKEGLAPLGTLHVQIQETSNEDSENIHLECKSKTEFVDKINVKYDMEGDCWITGMAMISEDEILLADNANSSLKILDIKECKVTSMCKTSEKPLDVAVIKSGTAAATLPGKGEILLMNTRNGLTQDNALKVRKNCRGIDHQNGLLAVTFISPPAVQILNLEGEILHSIYDSQMFRHPCSVVFTNDNNGLFVSDFMNNTVYKLKIMKHRIVRTKYEDLNRPSGLAVTKSNKVMICCTGYNGQISVINAAGGKQIHALYTEHVHKPVSVVISEGQNYICISENKGAVDTDFIKVYHLHQ